MCVRVGNSITAKKVTEHIGGSGFRVHLTSVATACWVTCLLLAFFLFEKEDGGLSHMRRCVECHSDTLHMS